MTLSGTWCGGSEVRFMSAVEFRREPPDQNNTGIIPLRWSLQVQYSQQGGAGRCEPSNSGQWRATKFDLRCVTILPPKRRIFYVRECADQAPSASGSLAGIGK
jgi:hypothetical protein